ncbi:hypothetical protein NL676_016584 [Syzygium grande]|nr:hypothetical protein NL676_016584 [Syzygium grande]
MHKVLRRQTKRRNEVLKGVMSCPKKGLVWLEVWLKNLCCFFAYMLIVNYTASFDSGCVLLLCPAVVGFLAAVYSTVLAGLAFMFSSSILLQILACALYNNWWPMLSALMYILVPMPCLFFGGGSTQFLISRDGGGWIDAAKFLTGASAVGSFAIPIILRHADLINTGAMFIEFTSFIIFVFTVMCFHRASLDDEW